MFISLGVVPDLYRRSGSVFTQWYPGNSCHFGGQETWRNNVQIRVGVKKSYEPFNSSRKSQLDCFWTCFCTVFHCAPLVNRLGLDERLGGNAACTLDLSWPKGYSISYELMQAWSSCGGAVFQGLLLPRDCVHQPVCGEQLLLCYSFFVLNSFCSVVSFFWVNRLPLISTDEFSHFTLPILSPVPLGESEWLSKQFWWCLATRVNLQQCDASEPGSMVLGPEAESMWMQLRYEWPSRYVELPVMFRVCLVESYPGAVKRLAVVALLPSTANVLLIRLRFVTKHCWVESFISFLLLYLWMQKKKINSQ